MEKNRTDWLNKDNATQTWENADLHPCMDAAGLVTQRRHLIDFNDEIIPPAPSTESV